MNDKQQELSRKYGSASEDYDTSNKEEIRKLTKLFKSEKKKRTGFSNADKVNFAHSHNHEHQQDDFDDCFECNHEHSENSKLFTFMLVAAAVLFVIGLILKITPLPVAVSAVFLIISALLAGIPVFINAFKIMTSKESEIDENILMTIAVIAAIFLGEFAEAAAVALFFRLGESLEEYASNKSRESIRSLSEIKSETANVLLHSGKVETIESKNVDIGTRIIIYPHERVPVDCKVIDGESSIDKSAITGESLPVPCSKGTQLLSGSVNGNNTITAETTNTLEESAASKIIRMVEEASSKKSKSQKAISRIAGYYTPAVIILALIVALIPSIITGNWAEWSYRALVLVVIACPCALVLSVPLGFFTGIGTAARKGILIKGSKYIEEISQASCAVFDKTGTLTTDKMIIESVSSPVGLVDEAVILLAAIAEHKSTHPIALTLKDAAPNVEDRLVSDIREFSGYGASAVFCGKTILCGSKKLFEERNIDTGFDEGIFVAVDDRMVGNIRLKTEIRQEAKYLVNELHKCGIHQTVILTGDSYQATEPVAHAVGVSDCYCDMLPGDKVEKVKELKEMYGKVIYVGDGINDAPVLAEADVGIGMGLGSTAANEAADIVLADNNLMKLIQAKELSQKTMRIFKINVAFILAVKVIVMLLGIFGIAPMWLAVFSDVGVCFISVLISSAIAGEDIKSIFTSIVDSVKKAVNKIIKK